MASLGRGGDALGTAGNDCRGARAQLVRDVEDRERFKLDRDMDVSESAGEAVRKL